MTASLLVAAPPGSDDPSPETKGVSPESFFPSMAWDYADKESTLEAMRDAGINAVAFVRPSMLDACRTRITRSHPAREC